MVKWSCASMFLMRMFLTIALCLNGRGTAYAAVPIYVFNSDGGAAAIAHIKGVVSRDVVCHELNELAGAAVTELPLVPDCGRQRLHLSDRRR